MLRTLDRGNEPERMRRSAFDDRVSWLLKIFGDQNSSSSLSGKISCATNSHQIARIFGSALALCRQSVTGPGSHLSSGNASNNTAKSRRSVIDLGLPRRFDGMFDVGREFRAATQVARINPDW